MKKLLLFALLSFSLKAGAAVKKITVDVSAPKKEVVASPVGINLFMLYDHDDAAPRRFPMWRALSNLGVNSVLFNEGEYGDWYIFTHPDSLHLLTKPDAPLYPYLIDIKSRGIDAPLTDIDMTPAYPGYPLNREGYRPTVDFNDFIDMCRQAGATDNTVIIPTYPVDRSAAKDFYPSEDDMVALAAAMVDYANNVMNAGIRFWEIGNEHYWENNNDPDDTEYAQKCARLALRMARAMKAKDPSIEVGVNAYKYKWVEALLNYSDSDGRLIDWIDNVIPHQYANQWEIGTYGQYLTSGLGTMHEIEEVHYALAECPTPDDAKRDRLKVQVTETSAFMAGNPAHLVRNCAWVSLANFEHLMQVVSQPRVEYCHFWITRWTDDTTYWSALMMDNSIAPMGWPVKLINDNLRRTVWYGDLSDTTVRCYASSDANGVTLFMVNRSATAQPVSVELLNAGIFSSSVIKYIWAENPDGSSFRYGEGRGPEIAGACFEAELKPLSVTVIVLK